MAAPARAFARPNFVSDPRGIVMKRIFSILLSAGLAFVTVLAQNPTPQQPPPQQIAPEDVLRITTNLVQTDVVVTDKNDQIIPDLKIGDFELLDNGKRQDIKFMEYVGIDTAKRVEG